MRILHVIFSSGLSGSERYCVDLANRQAAGGHEVHLIGQTNSPVTFALVPEIKIHPVRTRIFRRYVVAKIVRDFGFDVCHGHLSGACKVLCGVTVPTVATLHVGYKRHQHRGLGGLICVNHSQACRITGYPGLVCTIPNWIPQVRPSRSAVGIRSELGLKDAFIIGAVGRLHRSKGMDLLISAFRDSPLPNAALVICGEGSSRRELESLRRGDSRIHLVGYRSDLQPVFADLDLFVSPSREESFGLAIVEAMNEGIPIVATATEGPNEFLPSIARPLIPVGSVEELASALTKAHSRFVNTRRRRIKYDMTYFDPNVRINEVADFYGRVARSY